MAEQEKPSYTGGSSEQHWGQADRTGDTSIKQMFGFMIGIVLVIGWGVSIGVNYQRMNGFEKAQSDYQARNDERVALVEAQVKEGLAMRIKLQKDVDNLIKVTDKNGEKLDKLLDLFNEHLRQAGSKSTEEKAVPFYGRQNSNQELKTN